MSVENETVKPEHELWGTFDLCGHSAKFIDIGEKRRCDDCQRGVDEKFDEFWRDLIYPNGEIDVEEMKGDLIDFSMLMENAGTVYGHITCGNIGNLSTTAEAVIGETDRQVQKQIDEAVKEALENQDTSPDEDLTIPQLTKRLENLKAEKAAAVVPKFQKGESVHRYGYSDCSGEVRNIDISIDDDGEPTITYTIENVGMAWESELELSKR